MLHNTKFKQGAASFYIVAIATLILVIMATSFAAIIMSEIARTSNDDLAQSAYDSALAGIEDAKLAYYEYSKCVAGQASPGTDCDSIKAAFISGDCNSVAQILYGLEGEITLKESTEGTSSMNQAYTCVKFEPRKDFTGVLPSSSTKTTKVIKISTQGTYNANDVASIRMRWGKNTEGGSALPPILEFGIIQTSSEFTLDDFTMTYGDRTNRGTLFLEPTSESGHYSTSTDYSIGANELLKSNNKVASNPSYPVTCDTEAAGEGANDEFLCAVDIQLPIPVGEIRSNDTFMVVLSMLSDSDIPFNFALCGDGGCEKEVGGTPTGEDPTVEENIIPMDLQLGVDSTGRANDLYRRVYTILEPAEKSTEESISTYTTTGDLGHASLYYALSAQNIKKIEYSTCETVYDSTRAGCED